jgi:hypothetical protein
MEEEINALDRTSVAKTLKKCPLERNGKLILIHTLDS